MTSDPRRGQAKTGVAPPTVPSVGQGDMSSISKIDLDLHGDAIGHRQDEPQPKPGKARNGDRTE